MEGGRAKLHDDDDDDADAYATEAYIYIQTLIVRNMVLTLVEFTLIMHN